ncbi:hypothetical protein PHYSODRAFT_285703 [Phytophthora sojae]|uniref:RxLR effector PexRD54 WY domain-containing protein n=2 Tax=Phytophthora sojae TaxID=67593 RepID=G4Z2T5_PHYSP|nr:hypothetical protein PHYSODRAFT_285703 [Phytophthora sojae]AEK80782.1 Avh158 [Phytophthora sojae]AEK80783.1 Avh158 [Phytophthora sojae]EGZ22210.1 hypothetical protein PHYSODRAFT_285703 [Phytophthora sojae]|eukprot:XP_009524927.1 hypothetical protein PHYSODRAFT_285703 [Phytophthora sojae]
MAFKAIPAQRRYCAILLVALALAVSISDALPTTNSKTFVASAPSLDQAVTQTHRHLRAYEDGVNSEEKGFEGITKLAKMLSPNKQEAADKLFINLKLQKEAPDLFGSPKFQTWMKSIQKSYKKTPEAADAAMVVTLRGQWGDEKLAKVLQSAMGSSSTKAIAARLEDVQFKKWIGEGKTADDAFNLLKLDEKANDLLKNPVVKTWVSYVEKLDVNPYELLLAKLETHHTAAGLARTLLVARQDYTTRSIAGKLQEAQLERWSRKKRSADYIFKLLQLDKEGDKLFKNPVLGTWESYVTKLDEKNANEAMLAVLKIHYSDEKIGPMFTVAKTSGSASSVAARLEHPLLKAWANDGKDAADVFTLFRLDKEGDKLFENPQFATWAYDISRQGRENPNKVMLSVMKAHYSDESLEKMMLKATHLSNSAIVSQLRSELWLSQGKTVDKAFQLFKLDEAGKNFLEDPGLGSWVSYVTTLSKAKKSDEFAAISFLADRFRDFELAKMLSAAKIKNSGGNNRVIEELQTLQFKKWWEDGVTPRDISDMVTKHFDTRGTGVVLGYHDFYKAKPVVDPL